MDETARSTETSLVQRRAVQTPASQATDGPPASLTEIVGYALADIDVREPSATLLEPVARVLFSLGVDTSRKDQSKTDPADFSTRALRRSG